MSQAWRSWHDPIRPAGPSFRGTATGAAADREDFVRRYDHVIRTYLAARCQHLSYSQEVDDAVQEVFLECFRQGGILGRADPGFAGGILAYLYGTVLNIALRVARERRSVLLGRFRGGVRSP
jgi:hypothetical protein